MGAPNIGLLRSLLFMPGSQERMMAKTPGVTADAVIWDLEDAVAPQDKDAARNLVRRMLGELGYSSGAGPAGPVQTATSPSAPGSPAPIFVRVNAVSTGQTEVDLETVVGPGLAGIMLPKCESSSEVAGVCRTIGWLEAERGLAEGSVAILALVETALGIVKAYEVASASPRVQALCLGAEDLTRDMGVSRSRDGLEIVHARGAAVLAAAAAGVQAVDTVYVDLDDAAGLERECALARRFGFGGKLAIHPKQVETMNRAFSPTEAEVDYARRVVTAFQGVAAAPKGVVVVDGKMVDRPVVERALKILAAFERVTGSR